TSRVEENLSAGNARLFARTEFDRYATGEAVTINLHALTVAPGLIAREISFLLDDGRSLAAAIHRSSASDNGCESVPTSHLRIPSIALTDGGRGHLVLTTCEPRVERTPASVGTNTIEIR